MGDNSFDEDWTADVVGRMHKYRISNAELAEACAEYTDPADRATNKAKPGIAAPYLSQVLNGRKDFKSPETKQATISMIVTALDGLIAKKEAAAALAGDPE